MKQEAPTSIPKGISGGGFTKAVEKVLPHAKVKVAHTINKGIFCEIEMAEKLDENIVMKIKDKMHELAKADIPFKKETLSKEEAIKYFEEKGFNDKVSLLFLIEKILYLL